MHHVFSARGKLYKIYISQVICSLIYIAVYNNNKKQHNFMTNTHVSSAFFGFETSMQSLCTTTVF